jgi:hypothetical protein
VGGKNLEVEIIYLFTYFLEDKYHRDKECHPRFFFLLPMCEPIEHSFNWLPVKTVDLWSVV